MTSFLGIASDKVLHFLVSFMLAWIDPALSALMGIGKEIWDSVSDGAAEWGDLVADLLGILAAVAVGA